MTGLLKTIGNWLFWNGVVPLFAIAVGYEVFLCIRNGSLEPLLSFGNTVKHIAARTPMTDSPLAGKAQMENVLSAILVVYFAITISAYNLAITLVARLIYWTFSKVSNYDPLASTTWPIRTVRVLLGGFVAPLVAASIFVKQGGASANIVGTSVLLYAMPYATSTLVLTVLLLGIGFVLQAITPKRKPAFAGILDNLGEQGLEP